MTHRPSSPPDNDPMPDDLRWSASVSRLKARLARRDASKAKRLPQSFSDDPDSLFARYYSLRHKEQRKTIARRRQAAHINRKIERLMAESLDASLKEISSRPPHKRRKPKMKAKTD